MPERHRHHDSTERRKLFTITLESCSRSGGIRVHDAVETVITMSRNMHSTTEALTDLRRRILVQSIHGRHDVLCTQTEATPLLIEYNCRARSADVRIWLVPGECDSCSELARAGSAECHFVRGRTYS
jgi:hypothetical protein